LNTGSPAAWPVHEAGIAAVPARDAGARAQAYFARWGDAGEVDLSKAFAELIILTASRTLMGARRAAAPRAARARGPACVAAARTRLPACCGGKEECAPAGGPARIGPRAS
jgi:hypothetical protein